MATAVLHAGRRPPARLPLTGAGGDHQSTAVGVLERSTTVLYLSLHVHELSDVQKISTVQEAAAFIKDMT